MNARVPYLARLAGQAASPALRPPRPPRRAFGGAEYPESGLEEGSSGLSAAVTDVVTGAPTKTGGAGWIQETGGFRESAVPEVASGVGGAVAKGAVAKGAVADASAGPGQRTRRPEVIPSADGSRADGSFGAAASLGDTMPGRLPSSWADPIWGEPVGLPGTGRPEYAGRLPEYAGRLPEYAGRLEDGVPAGAGAGAGDAGGQDRGNGLVPRDLLPPGGPTGHAGSAVSAGLSGPEPGEAGPRARGTRPARVSIGTIEVTVVPPARPEPIQPAPPQARGLPRPASLLAAGTGADRLRDGLRRWHGTAQC